MTNRRRFLAISAASLAFPTTGRAEPVHTWQGIALGARATVRLAHPQARAITARVAAEISRLEDIFSLYRTDSSLMRLNRTGTLTAPPFELLECLSLAGRVHAATKGRFDPTIQPLWTLYAQAAVDRRVPDSSEIAQAMARTGWQRVGFDADRIDLEPGMALTLNGIAQGFIADRVAAFLSAQGLQNILIDTGEFRALGMHPAGGAWPVRLAAGGTVPLAARALATSAPLGTTFDQSGTQAHILDPRSGAPVQSNWREVSVSAKSAALADALSTSACLFASETELATCLAGFNGVRLEALVRA